jgi:hypothetical protein
MQEVWGPAACNFRGAVLAVVLHTGSEVSECELDIKSTGDVNRNMNVGRAFNDKTKRSRLAIQLLCRLAITF